MILQYASDLHLEFPQNKEFLDKHPLQPRGDVLCLAGDIVPFAIMDKHRDFFSYISDNFETTFWIPGNHEYYHSDLAKKSGVINENIRPNVHLVNNLSVIRNNIRFIFSTLWSKISPVNQWQIENSISDFHVIRYNDSVLTTEQFNMLHEESFRFISAELNIATEGKIVLVTHHVPTYLHYPEKHKDSSLNEAFATELHDLICNSTIDNWIYGHHHDNVEAFEIGHTKLLTNQLGYVKYNEQVGFNTGAYINTNDIDNHNNKVIFA